jgi:hypothetical protein
MRRSGFTLKFTTNSNTANEHRCQSYLWRSQELWMQPDIWEWADRNSNVKLCVCRICNGCEES